jgi:hypothetical protein
VVFLSSYVFNKLAAINQSQLDELNAKIQPLQELETRFNKASGDMKKARQDAEQYATWIQDRYYWADTLTELHKILIQVEADTADKLHTPTGIWIEKFLSATTEGAPGGGTPMPMPTPGLRGRPSAPPVAPTAPVATTGTNDLGVVTVIFRGVNLANATVPSANSDIAYATEAALKASPFFDKDQTQLAHTIDVDEASGTFSFGVNLKMKRPLKLP